MRMLLYAKIPHETFNANVGVLTVNTNDVRISSNKRTGSVPVTVSANVPLRSGVKLDPSLNTVFKDATTTFAAIIAPFALCQGPAPMRSRALIGRPSLPIALMYARHVRPGAAAAPDAAASWAHHASAPASPP